MRGPRRFTLARIADAADPAFRRALDEVRPALLDAHEGDLETPLLDGVPVLVLAVLDACELARPREEAAGANGHVGTLDDVERLALALARAQYDHVFSPPTFAPGPALVAAAEEAFRRIEDAADTLVARGDLDARDLPPIRGDGWVARSARVTELARTLRHAFGAGVLGPHTAGDIVRAERLAYTMLGAGTEPAGARTELRDRVYTLLRRELGRAERWIPELRRIRGLACGLPPEP